MAEIVNEVKHGPLIEYVVDAECACGPTVLAAYWPVQRCGECKRTPVVTGEVRRVRIER